MKVCSRCKNIKPLDAFNTDKRLKVPKQSRCRECQREVRSAYHASNKDLASARHKEWRQRNPEKTRIIDKRRNIKKLYGITIEEYDAIGSSCQICEAKERLALDHCHVSNNLRGKLCNCCNRALGLFGDDPEKLRRAALYLEGDLSC